MNVYDFDKTIYSGDSTVDFFFYELRNNPKILFALPKQILGFTKYFLKRCNKTEMKENFYSFLLYVPDVKKDVRKFWDRNETKIYEWYLNQQENDDVIISASPNFILEEICERLNIKYLLCSNVDQNSGKYSGLNCYGSEKVNRFKAVFENEQIEAFYSDSLSDSPLAEIANEAYIIKEGEIFEWPKS